MSDARERDAAGSCCEVTGLQKLFPIQKGFLKRTVGHVRAVDGVDFHIDEGETLGLVGESGCGKTTTGRCILRGHRADRGARSSCGWRTARWSIWASCAPRELRALRREMQMIFQDPYSSLNPRMTLLDIVGEPLLVHGIANRREREDRVAELLTPRRAAPGVHAPLSARLQRRRAPAHRHRPRAGPAPAPGRRRRAGLGAGRLGAGADPQPAAGPAGRVPADLPLRRARPERGASTSATAWR